MIEVADQSITERVILAREAARLNKTQFAQQIGLSKQAYTPYESGRAAFTLAQLRRIARVTNRPLSFFLGLPTGGVSLADDEVELIQLYRALPQPARPTARRLVQTLQPQPSAN